MIRYTNLFLWQLSKVSFGAFAWHMLPLVAVLMVALLILTFGSLLRRIRQETICVVS